MHSCRRRYLMRSHAVPSCASSTNGDSRQPCRRKVYERILETLGSGQICVEVRVCTSTVTVIISSDSRNSRRQSSHSCRALLQGALAQRSLVWRAAEIVAQRRRKEDKKGWRRNGGEGRMHGDVFGRLCLGRLTARAARLLVVGTVVCFAGRGVSSLRCLAGMEWSEGMEAWGKSSKKKHIALSSFRRAGRGRIGPLQRLPVAG
jgi:hypothetical protein